MTDVLDIPRTRRRHVSTMGKTLHILGHLLKPLTHEQLTGLRDGGDGWTVLEVVGHLRDFDRIFHGRVVMMLEQDYPVLPAYDHEAMAIDYAYNQQNLVDFFRDLTVSRQQFIDLFKSLTDDQWERAGVHPERGHFTVLDAAIQVATHDIDHIEQITKILAQPETTNEV